MSINTNRSFSHAVSEHRNKASGFTEEDIIYETFHNSLDADASIINYEFIQNKDNNYLIMLDDGLGCENLSQFFAMGNSIIRKRFTIGCKNIGFLGSISVIEPNKVLLLSKKNNNNNVKTIKYNSSDHYETLNHIDKIDNDYKKIDDTKFFETDVSGDIQEIINSNKDFITEGSIKLYESILKKQGTIIIMLLSTDIFNNLCELTIDDKKFMKRLTLISKEINKVNFYKNRKSMKEGEWINIFENNFKPIIFQTKLIKLNNKEYFEENCYANEIKKENLISTQYIWAAGSGLKFIDNFNESKQKEEVIGNFICKYYFLEQKFWENFGKPALDVANKRSIIFNFFNGKYQIFSESNNVSDPIFRNGGSFLFSIQIDDNNMTFAEKYLGIKMNKRLSTIDSFKESMKNYIIKRLRDRLVNNISHYKIYGDYGKYLKKEDYESEGVKDWTNYKSMIKDLLTTNDKIGYNILIEEYKLRHPVKLAPSPPTPKPSPKPAPKPSPKPAPKPSPKPKVVKELNVKYYKYWGEITFEINKKDFDEINIIYYHNNKEVKKIINNKDDDLEEIKQLNPYIEYEFKIIGKINGNNKEKIIKSKLDERIVPEKPEFTVDDSTHDIKFTFINSIDNGLPINKVLFFINRSTKIIKSVNYSKTIILPNFVHEPTKIEVVYENKAGLSERSDIKEIKKNKCERKDFTESTKRDALNNTRHKCAISGIQIDDIYFRCDFDHIKLNCNNSIDNCQPLLTEIHNIKTIKPELYNKLKDSPDELYKYKYQRIMNIFESLNEEQKDKIRFEFNIKQSVNILHN
uniref:Fibronectin type-III domain-containing protein n=1 Tax=viral metagenome TaxID=1070528 RepID=A0A6C0H0N9_9ZZZZ